MRESSLKKLLGRYSEQAFFDNYFGSMALHVKSAFDTNSLFNWRRANTVLNRGRVGEKIRFLNSGREEIPSDFLTAYRDLRNGLTLFYEDIDRADTNLAEFVTVFATEMNCRARFNMYVSSPGKQGLHLHYDTHDAFILQIEGSKNWTVYKPTDNNPLYRRKIHDSELPADALPYLECTLRAGDVLYVPKGHWHNVVAVDEISLHLTLGLFAPTGIDFLTWLVDECTENEEIRASLPLSIQYQDKKEFRQAQMVGVRRIFDLFVSKISQTEMIERFELYNVASAENRSPFNLPFTFGTLDLLDDAEITFRWTSLPVETLQDIHSKVVTLIFSGRSIGIEKDDGAIVKYMKSKLNGFTLKELIIKFPAVELSRIKAMVQLFLKEGLIH